MSLDPSFEKLSDAEKVRVLLATQLKLHEKIGRLRAQLAHVDYKYALCRKRARKAQQAMTRLRTGD